MKRAREHSSRVIIEEASRAGSAAVPTRARAPGVPAGGPLAPRVASNSVASGSPDPRKQRSGKSNPALLVAAPPLAPPPSIKPFSDDNPDEEGKTLQEGSPSCSSTSKSVSSSSSSSSNSSSSSEGGETKRRKRAEQTEVPGWRAAANAILEGKAATAEGEKEGTGEGGSGTSKRKFAVVCSSNVNRSIMAEILLKKNKIRARSFGTGREVKLPGKDSKSPQSFPFGTPYVEIRDFLAQQNEALFRRNSVLGLLERDATTKRAPERWQNLESEDVASFDVVVCFESRVFDLVVEDLHQRDPETFKPLHVVSMTIRDSAEDSAAAAGDVLELCKMLDTCDDLDSDTPQLLNGFRSRSKRTVLHQVCHV